METKLNWTHRHTDWTTMAASAAQIGATPQKGPISHHNNMLHTKGQLKVARQIRVKKECRNEKKPSEKVCEIMPPNTKSRRVCQTKSTYQWPVRLQRKQVSLGEGPLRSRGLLSLRSPPRGAVSKGIKWQVNLKIKRGSNLLAASTVMRTRLTYSSSISLTARAAAADSSKSMKAYLPL